MKSQAALKLTNPQKVLTVAVAGNPNSGKSTLINAIAGTRLQVGNWAGVTVEKKEALIEYQGRKIRLVDLPGTYSLSPYSQEEIIARDYLVHDQPDVIIDVVDATNLERNLYLTMQLLELGIPVVAALNIYDEAENKGYRIKTKAIEEMLGAQVIPTVATKKRGLDELLAAVLEAGQNARGSESRRLSYGEDIEAAVKEVESRIEKLYPHLREKYPLRWLALKLMENDRQVLQEVSLGGNETVVGDAVEHLKKAHGEDIEALMADTRYARAAGLTREAMKKPEAGRVELTEKIDRVVLNRFLGIPLFLASLWLVFKLTFDLSKPYSDWLGDMITGPFSRLALALVGLIHAPDWIASLINDGIIAGVGNVVVFIPVIFAMMFFITFLEGSGYMARAAFVMDRAMHAMGLHGKSFIPMLLGFGCNMPAIYATRTLENPRDRALTALLIPLMSCGARLPVYVVFVSAFFAAHSATVLWSLYVMGILLAMVMGVIFKRTLFRGEAPMFIMELPPYRMPSFRSLMIHTWEKGKHFVVKAGVFIFAFSIIAWFLLHLPWGVEDKKDSYLGQVGQVIAPALKPLGFGNWAAGSSLVAGLIAKEIVVGTMGEIYVPQEEKKGEPPSWQEDLQKVATSFAAATKQSMLNVISGIGISSFAENPEKTEQRAPLVGVIQNKFTPLAAFSFCAFVLLYIPCVAACVVMKQEIGLKWLGVTVGYQTALAWIVSFIIYQGGRLLGLG